MITITYSSVDSYYRETRFYETLKGAQRWAYRCVGYDPDLDTTYAVSPDGAWMITWTGCTATDLFPDKNSCELAT